MGETRIILAGLWTGLMLIYLLGDVLRIFAGDFEPGKMAGSTVTQSMWMMAACIMLIPIGMLVLNFTLHHPSIRWLNMGLAVGFVLFNLAGLPYPGMYDNFLIVVSFVFNVMIVGYAWKGSFAVVG